MRYGVSIITINKALSGLVSEGVLHSRVGRGTFVAVRPAPTVPRLGAGSARIAGGAPMLGFVLRDLSSPFFSLVAHGAQQRADAPGVGLLFSSSLNRQDREEEQIRRLLDLGVHGLIIVSMSRTYRLSEQMQGLHDAGFPYVMVSYTEGDDVPFVGLDLTDAGYLAGQHLIALGRRRLGYVGDRLGSTMFELRGRRLPPRRAGGRPRDRRPLRLRVPVRGRVERLPLGLGRRRARRGDGRPAGCDVRATTTSARSG